MNKRLLVFASGDKVGGGSGFLEMAERSRTNPAILQADIVAVVSNHANGGVMKKAELFNIPFIHFPGPYDEKHYRQILEATNPDFIMCSGWIKPIYGLPENRTINIHPGPLPWFGGKGMYGRHVHEAVIEAYRKGDIFQSAVSFHFVNDEYDRGAGIVRIPVIIRPDDDVESLAARVLKVEHNYQSLVLNEVIQGRIVLGRGNQILFAKGSSLERFKFLNF